ncbi:hydrogen gas-evolving membrane-bound hydrogenase subunit E [Tepidibacter formicigenes]|uniref:Multicomponent Na+:H+ antiporter subunit B n=1 Tax=Tepidibacter formicigenes DSM 15518 TaxID=1123349 RepID=A0A1M6NX11_9FIRM|nr:hydrogen gas-evolving membrane-bound hydrogenase subunit E [Tepidibacter formicigenes]SHK00171.1 multicomponent Na+:H+ antiporter subunit B [Tepidibacter formicigenes DSM 15518]
MRKFTAVILTSLLIGIIFMGVSEIPEFGKSDVPAHNYVSKTYLEETVKETGALNIITGIILDYRAFDTFVEATVLFTGSIVVLIVLRKEGDTNG